MGSRVSTAHVLTLLLAFVPGRSSAQEDVPNPCAAGLVPDFIKTARANDYRSAFTDFICKEDYDERRKDVSAGGGFNINVVEVVSLGASGTGRDKLDTVSRKSSCEEQTRRVSDVDVQNVFLQIVPEKVRLEFFECTKAVEELRWKGQAPRPLLIESVPLGDNVLFSLRWNRNVKEQPSFKSLQSINIDCGGIPSSTQIPFEGDGVSVSCRWTKASATEGVVIFNIESGVSQKAFVERQVPPDAQLVFSVYPREVVTEAGPQLCETVQSPNLHEARCDDKRRADRGPMKGKPCSACYDKNKYCFIRKSWGFRSHPGYQLDLTKLERTCLSGACKWNNRPVLLTGGDQVHGVSYAKEYSSTPTREQLCIGQKKDVVTFPLSKVLEKKFPVKTGRAFTVSLPRGTKGILLVNDARGGSVSVNFGESAEGILEKTLDTGRSSPERRATYIYKGMP